MRTRLFLVLLMVAIVTRNARSQDYFLIDQQSGDESSRLEIGRLLDMGLPQAQSFTPAFASIDFVRLKLTVIGGDQGFPASVDVCLWSVWSGRPGGRPLAVSELEEIPKGWHRYVVFRFQNSVPLTPETTYFIEVRQRSGLYSPQPALYWHGDFRLQYPRGMAWNGSTPVPGLDFWFQEGIVVPEPTTAALLLVGLGALGAGRWFWHKGRRGA